MIFIHVRVNDVHGPCVGYPVRICEKMASFPGVVRVSSYRKLKAVHPPALQSFAMHGDHPRCICMLSYFPSALKTVQISKNINSTNKSRLSA